MIAKMNHLVKINALFVILILFGLTFLMIPIDKTKVNHFRIDNHPQEYMKSIFIQNFTTTGQLKTQMSATYWAYTPEIAASTFTDPRLITYRLDGTEWHIRADAGQTKQPKMGSVEEVELQTKVVIERPAIAKAEAITVETETLRYQPKTGYAESSVLVNLKKPGLKISGIGLRAYLDENLVQLLDKVETHFVSDTNQEVDPITIYSKSVEFDEKNNKVTYQDEVIMAQGTSQLNSDLLIIEKDQRGKIDSMMATGQPAYFKTETNPNNPASGHAKLVNYCPKENKIHLSQDAELTQNNHTIQSDQLSYDLDTETLSSHPVSGQRTTVILQPKPSNGSSTL